MDDSVSKFGETLDGNLVEGSVLDDELALTVDAAFGTENPADTVPQVDVAVDGPATSRREINRFGTVVDSVLYGLGIVGTGVHLSAVVPGDSNPGVGFLVIQVRGLRHRKPHGLLGTVAKLVRSLGHEFHDLVADIGFGNGLRGALDFFFETACIYGTGKQHAFVLDGYCRLGLLYTIVFQGGVHQDHGSSVAVVEHCRHVALEAEPAAGHHLTVVFQAVLLLTAQGHVFQGDAVGLAGNIDAGFKTLDFYVFEKEGADIFGVPQVNAVNAQAVAGIHLHVLDGALLGGVETDTYGTGVLFTRADGDVADGVPGLESRALAGKQHRSREIGIGEPLAFVGQGDNGAADACTLQNSAAVGLFRLFAGGPGQGIGHLVDAMGQINDIVPVGVVV